MQKSKLILTICSIILAICIFILVYKYVDSTFLVVLLNFLTLLISLSALIISMFIFSKFKRESNKTSINKSIEPSIESNAILPLKSSVRFSDVAGINEAKDELKEIVDFLKNPNKYQKLGITLPKGVLLAGSPGVGKTLIAKALANEAGVPFFYQSGALFVDTFVGVGAKKVRELFNAAKLNSPSIIFIDEIDAVGKKRGGAKLTNEHENTLNQLLMEMDGFKENSGVIVIAATNTPESLDSALLRAGRFDRKIFIELPNMNERKDILDIYLKKKNTNLDSSFIASMTAGFSGAMLSNFVNEAALNALKNGREKINKDDFIAVKDKVEFGLRKTILLNDFDKEIYSIYGAGKIQIAKLLNIELDKTTLFTITHKFIDYKFLSKEKLMHLIAFYLAGNEALKLIKNDYFGIGKNDYIEAKNLDKIALDSGLIESSILNEAKKLISFNIEELKETAKILNTNERL